MIESGSILCFHAFSPLTAGQRVAGLRVFKEEFLVQSGRTILKGRNRSVKGAELKKFEDLGK